MQLSSNGGYRGSPGAFEPRRGPGGSVSPIHLAQGASIGLDRPFPFRARST